MLGVFDSGEGGRCALDTLRLLLPRADILFFADTENAPYGPRSEEELIPIVTNDIRRLFASGAVSVLMACCTASTVHARLPEPYRSMAFPILDVTTRAAVAVCRNHRYAVLATARTVNADAFGRRLRAMDKEATVISHTAGELVGLVESGHTSPDDPAVMCGVENAVRPLRSFGADTLVLGCTHFPRLYDAFARCMPGVALISSAEAGARAFAARVPEKEKCGGGRTIYL